MTTGLPAITVFRAEGITPLVRQSLPNVTMTCHANSPINLRSFLQLFRIVPGDNGLFQSLHVERGGWLCWSRGRGLELRRCLNTRRCHQVCGKQKDRNRGDQYIASQNVSVATCCLLHCGGHGLFGSPHSMICHRDHYALHIHSLAVLYSLSRLCAASACSLETNSCTRPNPLMVTG